jgi:hypothetical protein
MERRKKFFVVDRATCKRSDTLPACFEDCARAERTDRIGRGLRRHERGRRCTKGTPRATVDKQKLRYPEDK